MTEKMKTTADLIEELQELAASGEFKVLVLAVGFDKTTEFVFSTESGRLEKLNGLVKRGGEPIGFVGITVPDSDDLSATVMTKPLAEHAKEAWVHDYLDSLAASFGRTVEEASVGKVLPGEH